MVSREALTDDALCNKPTKAFENLFESAENTEIDESLKAMGLTRSDISNELGRSPIIVDPKSVNAQSHESIEVKPKPGHVLKTKNTANGDKIFINVCTSDALPQPKDLTDDELISLIVNSDQNDGLVDYRLPMSIGEPHTEKDKKGDNCVVYDIIIHPTFYQKMAKNEMIDAFFTRVCIDGLEDKYKLSLSVEAVVRLQNKRVFGKLADHFVRKHRAPLVTECDSTQARPEKASPAAVQPPQRRGTEPEFTLVRDPPQRNLHPNFIVAEVKLPLLKSAAGLTLDVGEDRILLQTRSNVYYLDIFLPFDIAQKEVTSEFNVQSHVLTVTLPVVPK